MTGTPMGRSLRIVEVVLLVAAIVAGLFAASVLLGTEGLGRALPSGTPMFGEGRAMVGVDDALLDTPVTLPDGPRAVQTEDGDRESETGLGAVEITGPYRGTVSLLNPTTSERAAYLVAKAAPPILAVVVLVVLLRIVRAARVSDPFTLANVRRLRAVAVLVGAGGIVVGAGADMLEAWMLDHSAARLWTAIEVGLPLNAVVVGVLIAVLAEVWAHGVRLREDVEGLV